LDGDFSIVVGYAHAGATLIVRAYQPSGDLGYRQVESVPWALALLSDKGDAIPRRDAVARSLRIALELAHNPRVETESATFACGLAAYEAWIEGLARASDDAPDTVLHGNALGYAVLSSARGAAARYLRSVSAEFATDSAALLQRAADAFGLIHDLLQAARRCTAQPWRTSWTAANRAAQAEVLSRALELERDAVGLLAEAVPAVENPSEVPGGSPITTPKRT
jgi:hypothetical protein